MINKKRNLTFWLFNAIIFLLFFLIQYNGTFTIRIKSANPMLPLCTVLLVAMFASELQSVTFALIAGIITDGAASTPLCFNTVVMMLLALLTSLTVHYLFNNNLRSAVTIGLLGSLVYFFLRWIFSVFSGNLQSEMHYLLSYALPSVIYTAVLIIPLYFLEKVIANKFYAR